MLCSQEQLGQLLRKLKIPSSGATYLAAVRSSPPARRVRSTSVPNCCYRYASARMGCSVMAESQLEYLFLLQCEFGFDEILEYWEQPNSVPIEGTNSRGRRYRANYTADVLTIHADGIRAYEVKPAERCAELCTTRPRDWLETKNGFVYRPAKEAFAKLGIAHHVVTDRRLNRVELTNYELLLKARSASTPADFREQEQRILKLLVKESALTIGALLRAIGQTDATTVMRLIDSGKVACDLAEERLTNIEDSWVALDAITLRRVREGTTLIAMPGNSTVARSDAVSASQAIELMQRIGILEGTSPQSVSPRTMRQWRSKRRTGGAAALVPMTYRRGNRVSRLSMAHEELLQACIARTFLTAESPKPFRCYGAYLHDFANAGTESEVGERPITFPAFLARIRNLDPEVAARARGGKRAGNAAAPPVDPRQRSLLAKRPFHRAHIDHAKLDIHLTVMETGGERLTERPWLTIMTDECTGAVLAMSLSFRAPSRRSCALVLRDCVRRQKRLPECIVVDNGKEFESVYFEACLARMGLHKQSRPPGHARYGSSVERTFGVLKEELVMTLPGNAGNLREDRGKSSSHKGWKRSKMSLLDLHENLSHYFFQLFNCHASGNRLLSPDAAADEGLKRFSFSGIPTVFDGSFLVSTAIEVGRQLVIDHQRGVRHNGLFYSNPVLRSLHHRARVGAREEPWDHHCLYVLVKEQWYPCFNGPRPSASTITPNAICEAVTWLDSASLRHDAKFDRLVATHEMRSHMDKIESRLPKRRKKGKAASDLLVTCPPQSPSSINALPLPATTWEEA